MDEDQFEEYILNLARAISEAVEDGNTPPQYDDGQYNYNCLPEVTVK